MSILQARRYLSRTAAVAGYQPLDADLTSIAANGLKGYLYRLVLDNGTDAVNDINISAGAAADDNGLIMALGSTLTKQLDAGWAVGTNAGGLDTGTIANTTYHVWLIQRSDTGVVDALFSASASAPTMPASYDRKRRIGSILRESATIVAFNQFGDEFLRKGSRLDVSVNNPGTAAVTRTLSVPTGINVFAKLHVMLENLASAVATSALITELDRTDEAATLTTAPLSQTGTTASAASYDQYQGMAITIRTNPSAQVRSRLRSSDASVSLYIATVGWIDLRGKLG